jgi:Outer membrane lipoprotein carrier protein LolA-like
LRILVLILLLGAVCSGAARAAPAGAGELNDVDFNEVMRLLSLRQHGRAEFVEQHFLAVLKRPTESSGELRYDAPDRLEKRTLQPHAETLTLAGGKLTIERGHSRQMLDLHAYPQVQPFVESIRATLAGDRGALERMFDIEFGGSVNRWAMSLVPLQDKVKQSVAEVRIDGARDQLLRVEIRQPDGDRSLLTLRPAARP